MNSQDLVKALACALAKLRGEVGGYTEAEIHQAIQVLQTKVDETLKELGA